MKSVVIFIVFLGLSLSALAQKLPQVVVLPQQMQAPQDAKLLGTITDGNNATKVTCDYEQVVTELKKKAAAMGGNLVKIIRLIEPSFIGKCYKVKADVYSAPDIKTFLPKVPDAQPNSTARSNYATVYFYRLKDTLALISNYHVHLNGDSVVYAAKSRSKDSIKLYTEGPVTFWAYIEHREEVKLTAQFGHQYYIRCGLKNGEIRMVPSLEIVDNALGAEQYNSISSGRKNSDVKYLKEVH